MIELAFKLHSPITEEEWDLLSDVDFDHTPRMMFHTKHGKDVEYVKVVRCKDCKYFYSEACEIWEVDENDYCSRGERKEVEE